MSLDFFYSNQTTTPVDDVNAARTSQRFLLNFLYGREFPWPVYGEVNRITNITDAGSENASLPLDLEARCEMINRLLLDPDNGV